MSKCRVLLVEDNKINRDIASELLTEIGAEVFAADNGRSAINILNAKGDGFFDIIFMDIQMPVMDGNKATELIRAQEDRYRQNIPIVALTANIDEFSVANSLSVGMNDFLEKPVEAKMLASKVLLWAPDAELNQEFLDSDVMMEDEPDWVKRLVGSSFKATDGIKYCGSESVYQEFLTEFVMYSEKTISELEDALPAGNLDAFRRQVHAIKSFTASLGNKKLSEMSKLLEKASEKSDLKFILETLPGFKEMYFKSVEEAKGVINEKGQALCMEYSDLVAEEEAGTVENLLMIGKEKSYMTDSTIRQLRENGYSVDFAKNDANYLAKVEMVYDAILIFADEELSDNKKALVYIRDRLKEWDRPIILLGYPVEMRNVKDYIPEDYILAEFVRPIDVMKVVKELRNVFVKRAPALKKKILVVDDSDSALRMTKEWLQIRYTVFLADSGMNAIKLLMQEKIDMVLLDYEMPVCNGKQLMEMIRADEEYADIPIVFFTGKEDPRTVSEVRELNPAGFLLKSMEPKAVIAALESIFAEQRTIEYM